MTFPVSQKDKQEAFERGVSILCEVIRAWMERKALEGNSCANATPVAQNCVIS